MTLTLTQLLVLFVALVSLFSPVANVGPFAGLIGHFPREDQRRIAWAVFRNVAIIMVAIVWAGEFLFDVLGVTPHALSLTGGIALFVAGMPMMRHGNKKAETEDTGPPEVPADWREVVAVPMTFPMSIGGTTAAYIVSATAFAQNSIDLVAISVVVLLYAVVIWFTHYVSPPIANALGPGGRDILTRVGGIILVAIALGLMAGGLKGFFPILAG